jgi:hypothetical protein
MPTDLEHETIAPSPPNSSPSSCAAAGPSRTRKPRSLGGALVAPRARAEHALTRRTNEPPIPCRRCGQLVREPVWLGQNRLTKEWCQDGKPSDVSGERFPFHPVCAELAVAGGKLE